jgi:hypothetical protein
MRALADPRDARIFIQGERKTNDFDLLYTNFSPLPFPGVSPGPVGINGYSAYDSPNLAHLNIKILPGETYRPRLQPTLKSFGECRAGSGGGSPLIHDKHFIEETVDSRIIGKKAFR